MLLADPLFPFPFLPLQSKRGIHTGQEFAERTRPRRFPNGEGVKTTQREIHQVGQQLSGCVVALGYLSKGKINTQIQHPLTPAMLQLKNQRARALQRLPACFLAQLVLVTF